MLLLDLTLIALAFGAASAASGLWILPAGLVLVAVRLDGRRHRPATRRDGVAVALLVTAAAGTGAWRGQDMAQPPARDGLAGELRGSAPTRSDRGDADALTFARVTGRPRLGPRGWRVSARVGAARTSLTVESGRAPPTDGDLLVVRCGAATSQDRSWRRCAAVGDGASQASSRLGTRLAEWQERIASALIGQSPSRGGRALAALATGASGLLAPLDRDRLARLGLLHLWAVSGLHVGLVGGALAWLVATSWAWTGRCARPAPAALGVLAAIPVTAAYAAFTGGSAATVRAALCFVALAALRIARRPVDGPTVLRLVLLIEVALPVASVASLGAALSHVAVVAIVAVTAGRRSAVRDRGPRWVVATVDLLRVGAAATAATAGCCVAAFGSVAPAGVVLGVVAVPLVACALLPLALAAAATAAVAPATLVALTTADLARWCMAALLATLEVTDAPGLRWTVPLPAAASALCLGALIPWSLAVGGRTPRRRRVGWTAAAAAAGFAIAALPATPGLTVTGFDVGHGDAWLLRHEATVVLIDGGPGEPAGDRAPLSPERLRRDGVHAVDLLIITHRHPDHFGGLHRVISDLPVRRCVRGGASATDAGPAWSAFQARLDQIGLACPPSRDGQVVRAGELQIDVLSAGTSSDLRSENDRSFVGRLHGPDGQIVFSGDAEAPTEERLAARTMGMGPVATQPLLLVPHHGSATSSTAAWLDTVAPAVALVSHRRPMPTSVALRYRDRGIPLCGTRPGGTVRVRLESGRIVLPLRCKWDKMGATPE